MNSTALDDLSPAERQKIVDFLTANPVGVLATVDANGNPHASTVYIGVDADLHVTFTTKQNTAKHENISGHSQVELVCVDATNQAEVQISGHALQVKDPSAVHQIYHDTLHAAKTTGEDVVPPVAKISGGKFVAYRIKPDNIWLSDYGWGNNFAHVLKHAADSPSTDDPA